jgi:hypothetical protein
MLCDGCHPAPSPLPHLQCSFQGPGKVVLPHDVHARRLGHLPCRACHASNTRESLSGDTLSCGQHQDMYLFIQAKNQRPNHNMGAGIDC